MQMEILLLFMSVTHKKKSFLYTMYLNPKAPLVKSINNQRTLKKKENGRETNFYARTYCLMYYSNIILFKIRKVYYISYFFLFSSTSRYPFHQMVRYRRRLQCPRHGIARSKSRRSFQFL